MAKARQDSYMPTRKVTAGGIGIPISIVIVWALRAFFQVEVPAEVATAIGGIFSCALAYFVKESV